MEVDLSDFDYSLLGAPNAKKWLRHLFMDQRSAVSFPTKIDCLLKQAPGLLHEAVSSIN